MRRLLLIFTLLFTVMLLPIQQAMANPISSNGYYKGIFLGGKVKVVNHFADFRVKVVHSFPDLKVKEVSSFPDSVGEWQFVDNFPDFTIEYVDNFPDFTIQFVDHFPGIN